jgi:hypothetical protein
LQLTGWSVTGPLALWSPTRAEWLVSSSYGPLQSHNELRGISTYSSEPRWKALQCPRPPFSTIRRTEDRGRSPRSFFSWMSPVLAPVGLRRPRGGSRRVNGGYQQFAPRSVTRARAPDVDVRNSRFLGPNRYGRPPGGLGRVPRVHICVHVCYLLPPILRREVRIVRVSRREPSS